ncbi:GTPase family protein [Microbacterium indicum]|uniref:GTPase family protein n=1 Tax=Microbacterium indicum TaxID=358100 RepID=UPI00041CC2A4|nr:GTPase [Microbacterium indicum]
MSAEPERSPLDETPYLDGAAQAKSRYGRFNLAVVGGTGVGKSSLVNAVFGRDLAKVGKGLPVTRGVQYYSDDSLGIWDIEGFEIGSALSPAEQLRGHLAQIAAHPRNEQISVVWYCVKANDDRLTPADVAMIRELSAAGLPVILVLTKVDWSRNPVTGRFRAPQGVQEFVDWLEKPVDEHGCRLEIGYERVILTSTSDKHGKGKGHGLGELVAETLTLSPEDEKDAFRIAQRLNLPWKRELARPVITAAAAAAAGAAAVPLPVADAVTLAPIQLGMMARISVIYDIEMQTALSTSALANLGAQLAGRALASSLLKLIPGAGSVVNAGVAAALTAATGEGWLRLCEQVHTGKIDLEQINGAWSAYVPGILDVVGKMTQQRLGR